MKRVIVMVLLAALSSAACSRKSSELLGVERAAVTMPRPANTGMISRPAPMVQITSPRPSPFPRIITPTLLVFWTGASALPTKYPPYKYLLLGPDFDHVFLADPDSLRRRDGPLYAGWQQTDATWAVFKGLQPGHEYLFVVIPWDPDADAPVFSLSLNMLRVYVAYPTPEDASDPELAPRALRR
jgi:hypothetical protein